MTDDITRPLFRQRGNRASPNYLHETMFTKSARFYDAIYAFKEYESEAELLHAMIQARVPAATTMLDVACGTGLHLQHLTPRYTAEGLDLDATMLEIARQRCPGVPFHEGDMIDFDLGRTFDVVLCLFSAIAYAKTVERMRQAVRTMARHLRPGGVLIVEPWLTPEAFTAGHLSTRFVDEPDLKIARMNSSSVEGTLSIIDFHYLVGTPEGFSYFTERHETGLFTHDEYLDAFRTAGLSVAFDLEGLMGRGLYIGMAQ